jgi:hypothetical protein
MGLDTSGSGFSGLDDYVISKIGWALAFTYSFKKSGLWLKPKTQAHSGPGFGFI